ncbi:MAG TPA: AAA family ATPase [Pseudonocardia sp.]|jgi:exonuclease SbcC
MRPVRLEMHGFAAFREPTSVDFTGADYFALVGPTGAGKSTVIDAMTFALYGSVPRWDDRRTVALALSPTANRGTVRLFFDVGEHRYVAARELRRAASGGVTVRNARLERLLAGEPGEESEQGTEALAHDGAVSRAVEELLGLPFEQFCTCVVLPQGDFATFLHAKPADRQRTLTRILGLEIYEEMARRAHSRAKEQSQRAEVLAEQLGGYADATEQARADAVARQAALTDLVERVHKALPALAEADAEVAETGRRARRLAEEHAALAGLREPAGLAELARVAGEARRGRVGARRVLAAAERADTEAREEVAGAPDREPLLRMRREHAELADLRRRLPELTDAAERARRATAEATERAAEAATALDAARSARDRSGAAHDGLRADTDRWGAEREQLASVRAPAGLAGFDARRREADQRLAAARRELTGADADDTAARQALAGQPDRAVLTQARRDHTALADARERERALRAEHASAAEHAAAEDAALAAAERALAAAREHRHERVRTDLVATLRPGLELDRPCPVCDQPVHALPEPVARSDVRDAEEAERRAVRERDETHGRQRSAADRARGAAADLAASAERVRSLRATLADAPGGVAGADRVAELLGRLDEAEAAARSADGRARRARAARDDAEAEAAEVTRRSGVEAARLRAVRDPLVPLGAPALDGDEPESPVAGWRALTEWARRAAEERAERLVGARGELAVAEREHERTGRAAASAVEEAQRRRRAETGAVRAEQDAAGELARGRARIDELAGTLTGAPPDAELARRLAERDELDRRAAAADGELRAARATLAEADAAARSVAARLALGWRELRAARDPLVALGAPEFGARPGGAVRDGAVRDGASSGGAGTDGSAAAQDAAAQDAAPQDAAAQHAAAEHAAAHDDTTDAAASESAASGEAPTDDDATDTEADGDELVAAWAALAGWARRAAADRAERLADTERALAGARRVRQEVLDAVRADLDEHDVPLPTDRSLEHAAAPAASAAAERARAAVARIDERRRAAATLVEDKGRADESAQVARMLAGLLRSDQFPRWLVASALDTLVADASRNLAELSGGQFALVHAGGEFQVVDHADADARRPVKTLSGGETFQASLALALALSEQLATLAAAGAPRLDSIFLDEGFGTLDEANLEIVAATLENLASIGDRMVGVITHVPALAERVPVRFAVSRDQRTASITRETG